MRATHPVPSPRIIEGRTTHHAPHTALIHDWLNQIGGAENVLETLVRMFPAAPVFTSMYAADVMPAAYRAWDIRTTSCSGCRA